MKKKDKLLKKSPFTIFVLIVTLIFSIVVILAALILNYSNLVGYAKATGYGPIKSYLWPALIDIGLLVALLNVIVIDLRKWQRGFAYTWALVIFFSIITVLFNIQHAGTNDVARLFVNVLPAILIVLLMELMRIVILNVATDNIENVTPKKSSQQNDAKEEKGVADKKTMKQPIPETTAERKELAIKLYQSGTTDLLLIATKIGVKDVRTVKSYLKEVL